MDRSVGKGREDYCAIGKNFDNINTVQPSRLWQDPLLTLYVGMPYPQPPTNWCANMHISPRYAHIQCDIQMRQLHGLDTLLCVSF